MGFRVKSHLALQEQLGEVLEALGAGLRGEVELWDRMGVVCVWGGSVRIQRRVERERESERGNELK